MNYFGRVSQFENSAIKAFVAAISDELCFAQILIRRNVAGFELRHVDDAQRDSNLHFVEEKDLRELAQFTETGAFRPLKSSPNLRPGWRFVARNERELDFALNTLYPGAVADWFAVNFENAKPTNYREFTNRQTGMYRITTMLSDEQATPVIRACCHKNFCLKQRLWTIGALETDSREEKSLIPCLEPCAILLEFARKAVRLEQQGEKVSEPNGDGEIREADFDDPNNPRRLQLTSEKQKLVS